MESTQTTGRMTVRDFARSRQISVQAVYKQINSGKLQTEKEQINGRYILYVLPEESAKQVANHLTGLNTGKDENVESVVNGLNQNKPDVANQLNREEGQINRQVNPLNETGIEDVEEIENQVNPSFNSGSQPDQPPETAGDQNIIAFLQEQLRAKDDQISNLQEQNRKKDEIIAELARNAQVLQAQTNRLLLAAQHTEEPEDGDQTPEETEAAPVSDEQTTEPQKKRRGFFYRLFFGED